MSRVEDVQEEMGPRVKGAQTLERGLDILEHVVRQPMRLAKLCKHSGLSRGTTIRLVNGLVERGFLSMSREGMLRAGPMVFRQGAAAEVPNDAAHRRSSTGKPFHQASTLLNCYGFDNSGKAFESAATLLDQIERHIDDHVLLATDHLAPAELDQDRARVESMFCSRLFGMAQEG